MPWTAHDLRDAISDIIGALEVRADYVQIDGDAWTQSQTPLGPFDLPEDSFWRHLLYDVWVVPTPMDWVATPEPYMRTVVTVYSYCDVRTLGDEAEIGSRSQALAMARHLWQTLIALDAQLPDITTIPGPTESRQWVESLTQRGWVAAASVPILYIDHMEA